MATVWNTIAAPIPPTPTYVSGNLQQQSGFNILQESGSRILIETITSIGFTSQTNQPITVWA